MDELCILSRESVFAQFSSFFLPGIKREEKAFVKVICEPFSVVAVVLQFLEGTPVSYKQPTALMLNISTTET